MGKTRKKKLAQREQRHEIAKVDGQSIWAEDAPVLKDLLNTFAKHGLDKAHEIHFKSVNFYEDKAGILQIEPKNGQHTNSQGMPTPIGVAHEQLDEWIRGEIKDPTHQSEISFTRPGQSGVIWLGKLKDTMLNARDFYNEINRQKPSKPHTGSTIADYPTMENRRGEQVPAIPLPLYGLKKGCSCGASFWFERNYEAHYALTHIVLAEHKL
jgi:hypothetical protein